MMEKQKIIQKINNLFSLATSSNINEAESAKKLATALMEKYSITESDLKSTTDDLYNKDNLLFKTEDISEWKRILSMVVAKHNYCLIIEQKISLDNSFCYEYYVFGEEENINMTKNIFNIFYEKAEQLINLNCLDKDKDFYDSYSEGVVVGMKKIIFEFDDYDFNSKNKSRSIKDIANKQKTQSSLLKPQNVIPSKPIENSSVVEKTFIKNVLAYFKGINDGESIVI